MFNASLAGAGAGSARNGQGTDRQYVNVANGNLVFQSQDEQLLFRGTALGSARTYNSQGTTAQVGADGWVTGFERRVELLQGQLGQAGSILRRHTGDGGYQDFAYVAPNVYRATSGEGAHDELTLAPGTGLWTYVEGTSRATETYAALDDAQAQGRLLSLRDGRSNAVTWVVDYDTQGRILAVRDADSLAALRYSYDTLGRLQQIEVHGDQPGQVSGRVSYGYDALGRLSWSLVDLTPESSTDRATWDDAGGNDGLLYRTSYAYDGDSLRISLVRQSDGTLMSYGYDGQGRVVTATVGDVNANDADGAGQTVSYRYDAATRRTDVSDATGATWTYEFDADGRLTRIELPARDGLRDVTRYAYDGDGNITQVATQRGAQTLQQTDFSYDAQGNVLWQWERAAADGSARAIQRTYSASNQVTSETRYTGIDADGAGSAFAPTGGMTTVYLYDGQDRLRFVVSPTGDVHEYAYHAAGAGIGQLATERTYADLRYDGAITLAAVSTWAAGQQGAAGSRVDVSYDAWGRLAVRTDYARMDATGTGIVDAAAVTKRYTYDARGQLLATLTLRGPANAQVQETETYRYDGLGRLLSEIRRSDATLLSSSTWNYLDSGMGLRVTSGAPGAPQRITTELRDAYGRTVSVTTSSSDGALSRTSRNYYDGYGRLRASENAAGGRSYYFYDNQGQLLAEVGPTGTAVSYERDTFGRVVASTTHATALNTASWVQAGSVTVTEWAQYRPAAHASDRVVRNEYDSAGLRVRSLDAEGNQAVFRYDGTGQLVESTLLDAAGTLETARTTRYFQDANGRQVATLDAAGYLTEQVYDAAGRLVRTVAYATAVSADLRATGTLSAIRPAPSAQDQTTRNFYDGLNRLVAVLDAEGYLSDVVYDSTNNVRATRSYARRLDALTGSETLQALLARVDGGGARETRTSYDALGRAIREVNAEGTVTQYQYDTLGQLVATQVAAGTSEIREGYLRYDALGNLIGELSGNGATHLLPGMSEAQLDAVYAQYGVRHTYDALGLRTESIDPEGNRTWYFHDAAGRLTHTVRGTTDAQGIANGAAEVSETRYDVFGQVIDSITYVGRLTIPNPGSRASVASAISTLQYVSGTDIRVQMEYDRRGQLTSSIDAQGNRRRYEYNAFGEQTFDRLEMGQGRQRVTQSTYDVRGLRTAVVAGEGAAQTSQSWIYDAFGRVISSTDGRGQVRQSAYDRSGRQVSTWQTVNGVEQRQSQTYDAFDRVLNNTDAEGGVTTYSYDDAIRTVTVRSAEGVTITTAHNRHGQVLSVADVLGNTTRYEYDASGNQTAIVAADGSRQTQAFSTRNLLASSTDASGRKVVYSYDAAGRLLTRTVDPQGLNLITRYGYDAAGRQLSVVDARGTEVRNRFDSNGNLVESIVDPSGLAIKTTYTWDAAGQQLSVTSGVGTAQASTTTYAYDALGRRISQTVDAGPGRLNLVTQYRYDANGNVVARIDPAGQVSRFVYDADNRVELSIDAAGGATRYWYDRTGNVLAQRRYANAIALGGLPEAASAAQIQARLAADDARDVQQYSVYDRDGQLRLTINGVGAVTGYDRDASGRVVREIRYANTAPIADLRATLLTGDIGAAGVLYYVRGDAAREAVSWNVLDAVGRTRFEIAADGSVLERRYDASGLQVATISYANRITLSAQLRQDLASGSVGEQAMVAALVPSAQDQSQYVVLDAAGRVRFEVRRDADGQGRVTEYGYLGDARVSTTVYGRAVVFDSQQTVATLQALVAPLRSAGEYHSERVVLDAAGRQRFTLDASGGVRETRYDAVGQVVASVTYLQKPGAPEAQTLASLTAWAASQTAGQLRLDTRGYDGAGRSVMHTDALGQIERFGYDAAGQMTSFTDTAGQVWTYGYNAAGQRTSETSPAVDVATVATNGQFTIARRALVTRTEYDALGNVIRRSEDADGGTPRITEYQYDNRGNQVRVLFPDPWVIDEASGLLVASGQRTSVEVTYDAMNRAVVQKDVRGNYSYKTYDVLGQLAYDVDAEGYVTSYSYDAYGNQTGLRRFATALNTSALAGWTAGAALTQAQLRDGGGLVANAADRQLLSSYNSLGQKVQTLSSTREYYAPDGVARQGTPTVRYQYDGYGNLQRLSELMSGQADQADAQWAYTWHYYDALGRTVMTVDAVGYATSTEYTSTGEVAAQTEHARALSTQALGAQPPAAPAPGDAVTGFDRRNSFTYDALGRKLTQTVTRQFQRADGSAGQSDVQTRIGYDALGRVTQSSDDNGTTSTAYDALGRVVSVREPERAALRGAAEGQLEASVATDLSSSALQELTSPYTTTVYDAFGNAVQMRRYANGWGAGQTGPVADDARDQIQTLQYDRQGRLVRATDALGNVQIHRYDAADKVVRTRQLLAGSSAERNAVVITEFGYDRSGRQLSTTQKRTVGGIEQTDLSETVRYNGFGEIVSKTHGGLAGELLYGYDAGGNMVQSNEGGADVRLGYNLAGYQVRQSRSSWNGQAAVTAVTTLQTDRLGRALRTDMPSFSGDANAVSTVARQFDRWGNVTQIIDARGYQTNYQYNSFNQVTRDERPLVEVVAETGARSWVRPVNEWFYDVFGRLVATRDANGHMRTSEYNNAGQLVKSRDGVGATTLYAYDALGNQRLQQNALGYVTFKQYDRLGRVTAIGDYLLNDAGTARYRTTLQQYRLNENGDRLAVTDALGYTALYDYDSRHLMVRSQTAMGVTQQYGYDVLGRKIVESNALSTLWGADRDGQQVRMNELSWSYDIFGRSTDHNDLGTRDYNYDYASSGQLRLETGNGGQATDTTRTYQYYPNGQLRRIDETGGNFTYYEYDAAGNRTLEEVYTRDGSGALVHTYTRTWYDSHNRIQRVVQDDASAGGNARRMFDIRYDYDAVGNRRRVLAQSSHGPNAAAMPVTNTAPTAVKAVADKTVRKGIQSEFNILFTDVFRDAEQDALTLDITQADGTALPSWLGARYNAATGEIIFTAAPPAGSGDTDVAVKLTARETANAANAVATVFTVRSRTNTAPRVLDGSVAQLNAKTGRPWAAELPASMYFIDEDVGDVLSLSLDNAAALPSWLKVDLSNPYVVRLSGTPTTDQSITLTLRATDQNGASVVKTLQLRTAANAGPNIVATPSLGEAVQGRAYSWSQSLSQLFVDPNGDPLQVRASGLPGWLNFTFMDQANPVLRLDGNVPSTVADGSTFAVTLTATDPDGQTSSVTLQLVVRANRAPVVLRPEGFQLPNIRVHDRLDVTLAISSLFTDLEGDAVSFEVLKLPSWITATLDQTAGTVRLVGTAPTAGSASLEIKAWDIAGLTSTSKVLLTIGQDVAPYRTAGVALNDATLSIGRNFSFSLPANLFTETDGDGWTLEADVVTQSREFVDDANPHYEDRLNIEAWPSWLVFNGATGTFSGQVPPGTAAGNFSVRIIARDGRGNATDPGETIGAAGATYDSFMRFNLVPFANSAPVYAAGSMPPRTINHGTPVNFTLPPGAFVEPDGDSLTYSAYVQLPDTWEYVRDPKNPSEYLPDPVQQPGPMADLASIGLSIDAVTGTITGTPTNLAYLNYRIQVMARDPQGGIGFGKFDLNVLNAAPIAPTLGGRSAIAGSAWSYAFPAFQDANQEVITYTVSNLPAWMSFNPATRTLSGTPSAVGSWTLTITGTDAAGASASTTLTVTTPNTGPVLVNQVPQQWLWRNFPWSLQIPANTFADANGDTLTWSVSGLPSGLSFDAATRTISGTTPTMGAYNLTVSVNDGRGGTSSTSFVINVGNAAPVYNGGLVNRSAMLDAPVNWPLPAGTFTDPNNDGLTYSIMVEDPAHEEWFWDASDAAWAFRQVPATWKTSYSLAIDANTGTITGTMPVFTIPRHPVTGSGGGMLYDFRIKIIASDGNATVEGIFGGHLTIPNYAPVAPTISARTVTAGTAWNYVIPAFSDANGDALTYTASGLPAWMSFNPATRTLSGTPTAVGAWPITITATDPAGASASATFTVTTPNSGPVLNAALPARETWRNTGFWIQLPANTFSDPNGDALTWSASGLPAGLTFDAATRVITGYATTLGTYNVTVSVSDGRGGSTSTSFAIYVTNAQPVYNGGLPNRNGQLNEQVNWPLPAGAFSDANGDALTYSIMVEDPAHEEWFWNAADAAWDFRQVPATWKPSYSLTINPNTGTITGPMPVFTQPRHPVTGSGGGYLPSFRIKIIATDGYALTEAIFGAYTNLAPTGSMGNRTIKSNVPTSLQVSGFSDPNGDAMTYSAGGLPPGMWFDPATLTLNGPATAGTYTVTIYANDGRGAVGSYSFVLTVQANNAPSVPSIGNLSMQVGTGVGVVLPAFPDPDGDPVTYQLSALPPGLWWDANSRMIGGTPTQPGTYGMTMAGVDNRGGVSYAGFQITVAAAPIPNRAPYVAVAPPSPAAHFYGTNRYVVSPSGFTLNPNTFADPDNNPLSYAVIQKPSFLSYSYTPGVGHQFSGVNNDQRSWATHTIIIRATDPSGLYVDVAFTVTSEYYKYTPGGPQEPRIAQSSAEQVLTAARTAVLVPESIEDEALASAFATGEAADGAPMARAAAAQAMSASTLTPWAGPVNIAGGAPPSGLGNVSVASGTGAVPVETKEYWYTYDGENRILVNNGSLQNGQIVLTLAGEDSYSLAYDAAGNVVSRTTNRTTNGVSFYWIDRTSYDLRGNRQFEYFTDTIKNGKFESGGGVRRQMKYDAANHLTASMSYYASGSVWEDRTPPGQQYESWGFYYYGGWLAGAETYSYDGDGRITVQQNLFRNETGDMSWLKNADDAGGRQSTDVGVLKFQSGTDYSGGYDVAGRLTTYRYITPQYTHTYTTLYQSRESWIQKSITGSSTDSNYKTTTNVLSYDAFGRLMSQRETTRLKNGSIDDRMRYYANDMDGKVINRREGTLNSSGVFVQEGVGGPSNFRLVQANGQQFAELREGFQGVFANRPYTMPQIQSLAGRGTYDAGGGQTVAQAGDTLRTIAQRVYGTDQLWYVLADANGFGDADAEIGAGTRINTPETSVSRNNANTFKPYDPASAIGNTTPSLPYVPPPPSGGCGTLGMIIMVVIIIVVTVYTAGAAAPALGSLGAGTAAGGAAAAGTGAAAAGVGAAGAGAAAGTMTVAGGAAVGAVAGAAGATAGMAAGSMMGVASFSWRGVVSAAATGAVTGGFGAYAKAAEMPAMLRAAGGAAAAATGTYAGQAISGQNPGFSWRSVAISAVTNWATAEISPQIVDGLDIESNFGADLAAGFTGGMVSASLRSASGVTLRKNDYAAIAADVFGNALANRAASSLRANGGRGVPGINKPIQGEESGASWAGSSSFLDPGYRADWLYGDQLPFPAETSASRLARVDTMLEQLGSMSSGDVTAAMPTAGGGYTRGYRVPTVAEAEASQAVLQLAQYNTLKYYQWRENSGIPLPVVLPDINDTPANWVGAINDIQQALLLENRARSLNDLEINTQAMEMWKQDNRANYDQFRGSIVGDLVANAGTIASNGGVTIFESLGAAKAIFTDKASRVQAFTGMAHVVSHPAETYANTVTAASVFMEQPFDRQMEIIGTNALAFVATAGIEMVVAKGSSVVGSAASAAGKSQAAKNAWMAVTKPTSVESLSSGFSLRSLNRSESVASGATLDLREINDVAVVAGTGTASVARNAKLGWPGRGGAGPVPGTIGITDTTSVAALRNYHPKGGGVEFVYDPVTNSFVTGRPKPGMYQGSPHEQLTQAMGSDRLSTDVVGGTFTRGPNGEFYTTENSGHYGKNWNNETRIKFQQWLSERLGLAVEHGVWRD
ncbi:putative Ig domain-containing protein [Stenotrophomonas rhizophila]|uniref:putative Ig domain-containing protein n=1 Tax=Stenotrophomonas rhizophila TaxID=216778 RepID=UPI001AEBF777|nr:putative Ig domain-containing protein [Stenotrophomonas rhizophila]